MELQKQELSFEQFLGYNLFQTLFKGSFDSASIFCLKLCNKAFKRHLDRLYPPFKYFEHGNWILFETLSKGYWKLSAYLFRIFEYQIPEHRKSKLRSPYKLLQFQIKDKRDIPYHNEIVENLFPGQTCGLDGILTFGNYCLFETRANEKWDFANWGTCFVGAIGGSIPALEYLLGVAEQDGHNFVLDSEHLRSGTYETLTWLAKRGLHWEMNSYWCIQSEEIGRFVIENIRKLNFKNRYHALLTACIRLNDFKLLKERHTDDDVECTLKSMTSAPSEIFSWNEKFVSDHFDLILECVGPHRFSKILNREEFLSLQIKLLKWMQEQSIEIQKFPNVLIKHDDLEFIKEIFKACVSVEFDRVRPFRTRTFEVFEWLISVVPPICLEQGDVCDLVTWKPRDDPRFIEWLKNVQQPFKLAILPECPKISMLLMDAFPRRARINDESIQYVKDLELLNYLSKTFHIEKQDKITVLKEFHSAEITDFLLQDLKNLKTIHIDEALLSGKVWLLGYIKDLARPWAKKLVIQNKDLVLKTAKENHHFHLVQLLSE